MRNAEIETLMETCIPWTFGSWQQTGTKVPTIKYRFFPSKELHCEGISFVSSLFFSFLPSPCWSITLCYREILAAVYRQVLCNPFISPVASCSASSPRMSLEMRLWVASALFFSFWNRLTTWRLAWSSYPFFRALTRFCKASRAEVWISLIKHSWHW